MKNIMQTTPESILTFHKRINYKGCPIDEHQFAVNLIANGTHKKTTESPYIRRAYYKISLLENNSEIKIDDHIYKINGPVLFFSNPLIPHGWTPKEEYQNGFSCVFMESFLKSPEISRFIFYMHYLRSKGKMLITLAIDKYKRVKFYFEQLYNAYNLQKDFKYNIIKNLLELIIYEGVNDNLEKKIEKNVFASQRIADSFMSLLEKVFNPQAEILLIYPSEFAQKLNIHINHLNFTLKNIYGKTTQQLIAQKRLNEAKFLLINTDLDISEIAYILRFSSPSNFIRFFRKCNQVSPLEYRRNPLNLKYG